MFPLVTELSTAFIAVAEVFALAAVEPSKGGLAIIIENDLSAVLEFAVALKVKLSVVSLLTSFGSPEITPDVELILNPAFDKTEVVSE